MFSKQFIVNCIDRIYNVISDQQEGIISRFRHYIVNSNLYIKDYNDQSCIGKIYIYIYNIYINIYFIYIIIKFSLSLSLSLSRIK